MPVIGHAFVGLATGMLSMPGRDARNRSWPASAALALWLPAGVVLAYLPDIAAEGLRAIGLRDARLLTHSVWFAIASSAVIALALARAGVSLGRVFGVSCVSVLGHDLLDLLQSTDRMPLWPLVKQPMHLGAGLLPTSPAWELVGFGAAFGAFVALRRRWHHAAPGAGSTAPRPRAVWLARGSIAAVVLAALATHVLRDVRERDLERGRLLIEAGSYAQGLAVVEGARRWPSTAKPGRSEYLKAEAYAGLGDAPKAEFYYLRAYEADPTYFWVVADLAVFYASADRSDGERRRLAAVYVDRLRTDFAERPELPQILARIERKLRQP